MPKTIEKIANSLDSRVYYPEVSLSNVEKYKIVEKFFKEIKDLHQKDALAAALRAFREYHALFLKIEENLKKIHKMKLFGQVVETMVKKRDENIAYTIRKIIGKKNEVEKN